jgi:hypothetical protein
MPVSVLSGDERPRSGTTKDACTRQVPPAMSDLCGSRSCRQAVQMISPRYREDLCLDAPAALEERVGVITPIDPT